MKIATFFLVIRNGIYRSYSKWIVQRNTQSSENGSSILNSPHNELEIVVKEIQF